ncbi:MAG: hypothetical protein E7774_14250 [Bradyrhizobium sp.]|nr:MAG: hypothetical protein E7774_14250 [Bradyrhizobium sp.]
MSWTARRHGKRQTRIVEAGFALAFLTSAAAGQETTFKTENSVVEIVEGEPVRIVVATLSPTRNDVKILGRTQTDGQCATVHLPEFTLLKPALHGMVCYRDERQIIRFSSDSGANPCVGSEAVGRIAYFRPRAGYVGTDAFQYAIGPSLGETNSATVDVSVTLTPSGSPSQEPPPATSTAPVSAQPPGAMESCGELTM